MRKLLLAAFLVSAIVLGAGACAGKGQAADGDLAITVAAIPHWHVLDNKKIEFTVTEGASGKGMAGLSPSVQVNQRSTTSSSQVTTLSLKDGQVVDQGDGIYSVLFTPPTVTAYAVVVRLSHDGHEYVSTPVSFDTSRAGEEGVKAEVTGKAYVYQIRWELQPVVPGHIYASDKDKVKLVFEIMRGLQEGSAINWEAPYLNTFDHVTNAVGPQIQLKSLDGKVTQDLAATYLGRGIYQAERLFSVAEVGREMFYEALFVFTDPYNGAKVQNAKPYPLHAMAPQ